jgi:myo-inositol-1(or 4)-monophosphatase
MNNKELEELILRATPIVQSVGDFIRGEVGKVGDDKIQEKALHSLVSYVDRTAEELLVERLGKLLPGATFLTEEETVEAEASSLQWIIDPLDGTTNFLHQLPVFSVSVALREDEDIVLGMVFEINRSEMFSAWRGGGAFLNGRPIRVSKTLELNDSLLATGFPYYDFDGLPGYLDALEVFMQRTRGIRRFGSAATDLAYVACGRFDAFFEYSLNPWDVAAGALLVQEAGGHVSDFSGGNDYLFGQEIIASNLHVYNDVLAILTQNMEG